VLPEIVTKRVALLCLLSLPSVESAECAWVEWQHSQSDNPTMSLNKVWQTRAAHATRSECEASAAKATEFMTRRGTFSKSAGGYTAFISFVCLPDTVDPRGPKGK